ncbi:hypothetical protein BGZ89_002191 [Linnemannia elongata]|nr:hypothetical protein BGZ89_002191 [Linnemannia elongata]
MTSTLTGNKPSVPQEPSLAITNCDSFEGQTLALTLADYLEHKRKHTNLKKSDKEGGDHDHDDPSKPTPPVVPQLVCITRDKNKCGDLNKRDSCKVVQISYDDPNTIAIALRGIQTVVFVPEIQPQRVDWADRVVDAMKQENITTSSTVSVVSRTVSRRTFRAGLSSEGFPFQTLFYWIPMVQDQGVLGMPIKRDREFAPLDVIDLGRALISVTFPSNYHSGGSDGGGEVVHGESSLDDTSDIQKSLIKLKLTGSQPYAAHETVSPIPHPKPIEFKELTRDEFHKYLLTLRNKSSGDIPMTTAGFQPVASFLRFFQHMTDAVKGVHLHHHQLSPEEKEEKTSSSASAKIAPQSDVPMVTAAEGNDDDDVSLIDVLSGDETCPGCKTSMKEHEPVLEAPSDTEIDLVLELLDYINENRATFQSGDLQKITGERGNNAKAFFEEHARNFRKSQSTAVDESGSPFATPASTVHSEGHQRAP